MVKSLILSFLMLSTSAFAADKVVDKAGDEAMERAAETLIREGAKLEDVAQAKPAPSEDETPVTFSEPTPVKSGGSIIWRLLISVVVIAAAGVGLTYASRRWGRRADSGGTKSRIELMHQFHLGPRKSLALIRVAGETMLVGVTDQNINMLKSITLIDDDMAAALNQDFNGFLEDEFSVADVSSVRDRRS